MVQLRSCDWRERHGNDPPFNEALQEQKDFSRREPGSRRGDHQRNPKWYHSIDLAPGVFARGRASPEHLSIELCNLRLPGLRGQSVLDIRSSATATQIPV
jgi:hypothetical protein